MSTEDSVPGAQATGISLVERDAAVCLARQEERDRIAAIVNSEAAEGRMAQAVVLATETQLSVGEATKLLLAAPKETRIEALAARAGAGPEIGNSREAGCPDRGARAAAGWKSAIANANRRFAKA